MYIPPLVMDHSSSNQIWYVYHYHRNPLLHGWYYIAVVNKLTSLLLYPLLVNRAYISMVSNVRTAI